MCVEEGSSNDDIQIGAAVHGEEAQSPRVDATWDVKLEVVNQAHRACFGRTRHRAGREGGRDRRDGILARIQLTADRGDQLVDRLERLNVHELGHAHRASRAHAPEVVADEVDDHQILRDRLLIGAQGSRDGSVLGRRRTPSGGAFDGLALDSPAAVHTHEPLWRGATDHHTARADDINRGSGH